ncbi:uncharacterized protein LOC119589587 [Penaeus monodon]|uniref:uncharacterized protein LOC119589587 n=1 Tax=Penaeus monodon TaxID=6687 RepID=UPI0018A73E44|nr:uncharacterized protein LOC119589587 [Penaeus monodon]
MKKRQMIGKHNSREYKEIDKEIKNKCRKAKEAWLSGKCEEIERYKNTDPSSMHRKIKELAGPIIIKSEVRAAVNNMKRNKAAGPDKIVTEMIVPLEEFGIEKLTDVINEIYDSGEFPEELSKSIFIALPKKPGAIECELHRTISLMSQITKIILKVIMARARNKLRQEIGNEQCGFVEDSGTRNGIWMTLQRLEMDGKDIRMLRNLYWGQTACMRVNNELGEFTEIRRGVRQGCVFSPYLFNLYSELILRELEGLQGFVIGGHNMNNIRYADDTVLISESEGKLQELLDKVVEESAKKGLTINCKKTECLVVSKKTRRPDCRLYIGKDTIKQVSKFNYLGSIIAENGKCEDEIKRRIGMAKDAFQKLRKVLKDRKLSIDTKLRVLDCYVNSILTYSSECWTISAQMERRLEAAEMWFLRRMFRVSWTDHVANEAVLRKAGREKSLLKCIRKRQMQFLGHIMRKDGLENLTITGKIEDLPLPNASALNIIQRDSDAHLLAFQEKLRIGHHSLLFGGSWVLSAEITASSQVLILPASLQSLENSEMRAEVIEGCLLDCCRVSAHYTVTYDVLRNGVDRYDLAPAAPQELIVALSPERRSAVARGLRRIPQGHGSRPAFASPATNKELLKISPRRRLCPAQEAGGIRYKNYA